LPAASAWARLIASTERSTAQSPLCKRNHRKFDRLFTGKTGFVTLDRLLARLHANTAQGARPPQNSAAYQRSENDIRCHVTRRKVSGGTRSDLGRDARDTFLGLAKTCTKLGWNYLGARLNVPAAAVPPM
jgi:hypothetical protein